MDEFNKENNTEKKDYECDDHTLNNEIKQEIGEDGIFSNQEEKDKNEIEEFFGDEKSNSLNQSDFDLSEEAQKKNNYYCYLNQKALKKQKQKPLVLGLIGLILSLVYGFGIFLSFPALIMSFKKGNENNSLSKWAKIINVIGVIVNLIFFITFIWYTSTHEPIIPITEPITSGIIKL